MKKGYINILILIFSIFILTWCFWNNNSNNSNSDNSSSSNSNNLESETYKKLEEKDGWLKNATSDDIDKIIQEKLEIINTPSSDYPFFKQLSTEKWNIEEIRKAWWMEITRWQIYLVWLENDYTFVDDLLSDDENNYTFHQKDSWYNFFFVDNYDNFLSKLKQQVKDYKEDSNENWIIVLEFSYNNKKYTLQITEPTWTARDDMDNILWLWWKSKITINLTK